jgi:hypothetical protein
METCLYKLATISFTISNRPIVMFENKSETFFFVAGSINVREVEIVTGSRRASGLIWITSACLVKNIHDA